MSDDFEIDDDEFDIKDSSPKAVLKSLWEDNPAFKAGVLIVGAITLYVMYNVFFTEEKTNIAQSNLGKGSTVTAAPGEGEADPAFRQAVETANRQRAEEAAQIGGSALPTPIGAKDSRIEIPDVQGEDEDPLSVWRRTSDAVRLGKEEDEGGPELDELNLSDLQQPLTPVLPQIQPTTPQQQNNVTVIDPELVELLSEQMRVIIATRQPQPAQTIDAQYPSFYSQFLTQQQELEDLNQTFADSSETAAIDTGSVVDGETPIDDSQNVDGETLLPAGNVTYAQVLNALNSDINGPVLAHILSGPFAGGRAIGQFERQGTYLVLTFQTLVKDNVAYTVDGIALDTDTTLAGVRSDVNLHIFQRVVLPAAAEFIAGFGEAVAETNETNVTVDGGAAVSNQVELDTEQEIAAGFEAGAESLSEFLDDNSDREITVKLDKGTPIGILFVQSVTEGDRQ